MPPDRKRKMADTPGAKQSVRKYACGECGKRWRTPSKLKIHSYTHTNERPFKCVTCGKGFKQKVALKIHIRVHTNERPHKCHICGEGFKQSGTLQNHVNVHLGTRPFKCNNCTKSFTQLGGLINHRLVHTDERLFPCQTCNKKFKTKPHLTAHKSTHSDARPFVCDKCGSDFKTISHLYHHFKTHSDKRPHKCSVCGDGFIRYWSLKRHMISHTDERKHECAYPMCGLKFRRSDALKNHFNSYHTKEGIKRRKKSEWRIKLFLDRNGFVVDRELHVAHKCAAAEKNFARVDFILSGMHVEILLEVDERQHDGYATLCEVSRMADVVSSIRLSGNMRPLFWLRYNPHGFKVDGKTMRTTKKYRETVLLKFLQDAMVCKPTRDVTIANFFYDCHTVDGKLRLDQLDDPEYYESLKPCVTEAITKLEQLSVQPQ